MRVSRFFAFTIWPDTTMENLTDDGKVTKRIIRPGKGVKPKEKSEVCGKQAGNAIRILKALTRAVFGSSLRWLSRGPKPQVRLVARSQRTFLFQAAGWYVKLLLLAQEPTRDRN